MDDEVDTATSVVVATDGSLAATRAIDWAAREAVSRREPLLIITACPPVQVQPSSVEETTSVSMMSSVMDAARLQTKEHQNIVAAAADRVRNRYPELVVTTEVFEGDPRRALELYESLASVVVLGSRGLGSVRSVLLGSVSFWATRHLTRPFVVVRAPDTELPEPHGVAVGIATDANSEGTLHEGFAMAARRKCPLTIANACWDSEATAAHWTELAIDDVEPRRRRCVTDLAERIGKEYPDVTYRIVFARGRVDSFLASLGRHTTKRWCSGGVPRPSGTSSA